jgi:hypothetical protein
MQKEDIEGALIEACPGFETEVHRIREEGGSDLVYVTLGDFARYLLSAHKKNRTDDLRHAGAVIERMHTEGDHYVREAATIGALEGIKNVWSNNGIDPNLFAGFLGSESRRWWISLNRFWNGEIPFVGADIKQG